MRIGSRIATGRYDKEGEQVLDQNRGTLIGIEYEDDDEERGVEKVTVRWDDGRVEQMPNVGDDWELVDVTPKCYLNLYIHDREYGGPEEGGWWYDTYTPVDGDWISDPPQHGHFSSEAEATAAYASLIQWADEENQSRRSPSSVLSEGHFVVWQEAWPAARMPARRPYYC